MSVPSLSGIYRALSSLPLPPKSGTEEAVSLSRILLALLRAGTAPAFSSPEDGGDAADRERREILSGVRGRLEDLYRETLSLCRSLADDADRLSRLLPALYALAGSCLLPEDGEPLAECDTLSDRLLFPSPDTDRLSSPRRAGYGWRTLHGMMRCLSEQLSGYEGDFLEKDPAAVCFRDILRSWEAAAEPSGPWPGLSAEETLGRLELFARHSAMWDDASYDAFLTAAPERCAALVENAPLSPEAFHLAAETERLTGMALLSPETLARTVEDARSMYADPSASPAGRLAALSVMAEKVRRDIEV